MHKVIIDDLEEYLAGTLPPAGQRRFQAHFETCAQCRQEVLEMRDVAQCFASLKSEESPEPSPSFVARIAQDVARTPRPSLWNPFLDFGFGRRVAFASLLTLAVLGTVLVSRETTYASAPTTPEAVMAAGQDSSPTADGMLVTLASYEP